MISKEEFFKRLKERGSDKRILDGLAKAGKSVMQTAEKLKGKTITLSLPSDMTLDSVVAYVIEKEEELSKLGILTCAGPGSFFPPYGFYPDVKDYINWQKHMGEELARREFFYDLIAGRRYDPAGRKLVVRDTVNTNGVVIREILTICDGILVESLEEADTAVYLGMRFCDPEDSKEYSGHPLYGEIIPWLQKDKDRAALVFYDQRNVDVCSDEGDLHILRRLASERDNVFFMPMGGWYKGRIFVT